MNSLLMKEVLKSGVDRKEFSDFVGLEIFVPTDEMYDLTEQAYTYSGQLYDIDGACDQFEKKAASFLKKKNLSKKVDSDVGFGFSYNKFFKYFELLNQQHEDELSVLQRQLEQLEAEKSLIQERKPELKITSSPRVLYAPPPPPRALYTPLPPSQQLYTPPPPPQALYTPPPPPQQLYTPPPPPQALYTTPPPPQALYTPPPPPQQLYTPPPPPQALYTPPPPPQALYTPPPPQKSQDVHFGQTLLKSIFVARDNRVNSSTSSVGQTTVYPNGHHFPCEEPMWC